MEEVGVAEVLNPVRKLSKSLIGNRESSDEGSSLEVLEGLIEAAGSSERERAEGDRG